MSPKVLKNGLDYSRARTRWIVVLGSGDGSPAYELRNWISLQLGAIKASAEKAVDVAAKAIYVIPPVTLDLEIFVDSRSDISSSVSALQNRRSSGGSFSNCIRVICDIPYRPGATTSGGLATASHVVYVEVIDSTGMPSWDSSTLPRGAIVRVKREHLPMLLHDIVVDIHVSQMCDVRWRRRRSGSVSGVARPATRKASVLADAGLSCPYAPGAPLATDGGYVCVAACARNPDSRLEMSPAEIDNLVSLWTKCVGYGASLGAGLPRVNVSLQQLVIEQIESMGLIANQLPVSKVVKKLKEERPGMFVLWVAVKKPSDERTAQAVAHLFRGNKPRVRWRRNMWDITKMERADQKYQLFEAYSQYCEKFPIRRHDVGP